jgi:hypothetical protein
MSEQKLLFNNDNPIVRKDELVHVIMKMQSLPEEIVIKSLSAHGVLRKTKNGKYVIGKKY